MKNTLAVSGLVATTPRHTVTQDGLPITSFRLATSQYRYDEKKKREVDYGTNWFTVICFKSLAVNTSASVSKGDRVIIIGQLNVRDWDNGEHAGTSTEIEAETIGHDLTFGTSSFVRSVLVVEVRDND